ncbi:MAG: SUMF1/EgtB/PvdO family nonheme iron enzyme [Gammaproteobacteria bacterium]|nr:SUMF1/EgtB/PvdO family nonheme iron enzyme [Gammaproteobacteria bacterium]
MNRIREAEKIFHKISSQVEGTPFNDFATSELSRIYMTLSNSSDTEAAYRDALRYATKAIIYQSSELIEENLIRFKNEVRLIELSERRDAEVEKLPQLASSFEVDKQREASQSLAWIRKNFSNQYGSVLAKLSRDIEIDTLAIFITSKDVESSTATAKKRLNWLRKTFKDYFPIILDRISPLVNNVIIQVSLNNLVDAHELKEHVLSLVDSKIIANVPIIALPKPSIFAAEGNQAIELKLLSEANNQLDLANQNGQKNHYQVIRFKNNLDQKLQESNNIFAEYQSYFNAAQFHDADKLLSQAIDSWTDNQTYQFERKYYDRIMNQVNANARLCRKNLKGLGKRSRGVCFDSLLSFQQTGPQMVVIPPEKSDDQLYAISKYEISKAEIALYCELSGQCEEDFYQSDTPNLPFTHVKEEIMNKYVNWLTKETGFTYEIPNLSQWRNAAKSGGREGNSNYNCRLRLGAKLIKGQNIVPIDSGSPNNWGLINYVGNVDEVVNTTDGFLIVGGNYTDNMSECTIDVSKPYTDDQPLSGFRVIRYLN